MIPPHPNAGGATYLEVCDQVMIAGCTLTGNTVGGTDRQVEAAPALGLLLVDIHELIEEAHVLASEEVTVVTGGGAVAAHSTTVHLSAPEKLTCRPQKNIHAASSTLLWQPQPQ